MDHLHECFDVLRVHFRQHAVTKVEDVTGPIGGVGEDLLRALADGVQIGEQSDRIEIPLHADVVADPPRSGVRTRPSRNT